MRVTAFLAFALCAAVAAAQSSVPQQIHYAFAGRDDATGVSNGASISWATPIATSTSTVWYGTAPGALTRTATGTSITYLEPYAHHHVVLSGLSPDTKYYYKVGDAAASVSPVLSFTTAPASSASFNVAVYGDLGYGANGNAIETRAQLDRVYGQYDWVLHVGDIGYADDAFLHTPLSFEYENVYNGFMNWIQNVSATKVLPGNHEGECHSPACLLDGTLKNALSNFTAYNSRFRMPAPESGAKALNMWYSFNYGLVHFIAVDTETDYVDAPEASMCPILPCGGFAPSGAQLAWLEADLKAAVAQRSQRPWIIVSGHRPIYNPANMNPDGSPTGECAALQSFMEDLFIKYDVDIYFSGHKHSYQRTYPVYNNTIETSYRDPKFPVHFIVGGAGCDEMSGKLDSTGGDPSWLAMADTTHYGMGILQVENATTLYWQWFASRDGSVLDKVTITKQH